MDWMTILPWAGFLALIIGMLALDLGVFHRDAHEVTKKESLIWTGVWVGLALLFNAGVFWRMGNEAGIQWFTGYVVEKSLAVDNVFVFLLIFSAFAVPAKYQHRVLFWGIIGALIMRAILIAFAGVLLSSFHWIIYVFGAFLIITGIRFLRNDHGAPSLEDNKLVKLAKRFYPVTDDYDGQKFFTVRNGVKYMTPLFLVLLLIETTDLVFAVDSIPAIYAITSDPFIVFTSNIMAILGLRAMYFVIAGYLAEMKYLKPGLAAVLVFVGAKMLLIDIYKIPALVSLGVIITILSIAILASFLKKDAAGEHHAAHMTDGTGGGTASSPAKGT